MYLDGFSIANLDAYYRNTFHPHPENNNPEFLESLTAEEAAAREKGMVLVHILDHEHHHAATREHLHRILIGLSVFQEVDIPEGKHFHARKVSRIWVLPPEQFQEQIEVVRSNGHAAIVQLFDGHPTIEHPAHADLEMSQVA